MNIPNSVTSIGSSDFYECSGLTSVNIPNSVTSIGSEAFFGCSGLTSLDIPNSVTSIGERAFANCSGLTSVTIEDGIQPLSLSTSSSSTPFSGCPIESLYLGRNLSYSSSYPPFRNNTKLTKLTIGNSVTSIGRYAFEGCSGLTSVTIGNSVTDIGYWAFEGCSGLTSVNISDLAAWCNIKFGDISTNPLSIAHHLLLNGTEVKDLVIPNSVTSIGEGAFRGCSGLTSVNIPNSVTSIGSSAFSGCSGLTSVTIGNSVTDIGYWAFEGCSGLTSVNISDLAAWCNIKFGDISANPLSIAHHLLLNGTGVKDLVIPNSVTSIGSCAFQGCSGLTSVTIPNSVTSIGSSAFSGCSGLTSVNIPNSVTSIGSSAFYDCSGLTAVRISDLAAWCKIGFGNTSANPLSIAHHLFLNGTEVKDLVITSDVTSIGDYAFRGCSGLTSVTISNSVRDIGQEAFAGCSGLTSVTIGNSVISIGSYAFSGCSGLTSLTIPNSVTSIGRNAFSGCSELTSLTIPNCVTYIGDKAFSGCSGLTSLTIEDGTQPLSLSTSYSSTTFFNCPIESLYLGRNLSYSSSYSPFRDNTKLTKLTIGNSVTSIGSSAFSGCSGLTSVNIPNSVKTIGENAFYGCSIIKEIRIGNGIKDIKKEAFANCPKLEDVYCYAVRYPETATDAFKDSYIDYVILHVPAEGVEPYSKQEPWSGFRKVIAIEAPEPSDYTLSAAGYATYYDRYYDTALPTGVKASVVTGASDSKLTYKVIANGDKGGIVPAGTAVLLQGKERRAATYTLTPKESTTHYTGENLLHGSDDVTTTTAEGDCLFYKLAYGPSGTEWSNTVGWFWGADEGRPFEIEGHKAWLAIPKGSSVKSRPLFYSIDGNAIELEDISLIHSQGEDISESEWYDLQGRRLNVSAGETPALPGVYIHNGKKVFVK